MAIAEEAGALPKAKMGESQQPDEHLLEVALAHQPLKHMLRTSTQVS